MLPEHRIHSVVSPDLSGESTPVQVVQMALSALEARHAIAWGEPQPTPHRNTEFIRSYRRIYPVNTAPVEVVQMALSALEARHSIAWGGA